MPTELGACTLWLIWLTVFMRLSKAGGRAGGMKNLACVRVYSSKTLHGVGNILRELCMGWGIFFENPPCAE